MKKNIENHLRETETAGVYELVFQDDEYDTREDLSAEYLMDLNIAGYVFQGSQTDIDFEDINQNGDLVTYYMDIHYFVKIDIESVKSKMNEFFPA